MKAAKVPPPQQIELKFINHENGKCTVWYKEITTVKNIKLAKRVIANTAFLDKLIESNAKMYRKGRDIISSFIWRRTNTDSAVYGLVFELLAQITDQKMLRKFMTKMIKGMLTKKQTNQLGEYIKKKYPKGGKNGNPRPTH